MDRIRAGLTGLGAVFLVTAAASLLFAPDEAERAAAEQQEPGEPLAQLGVAPGSDASGNDRDAKLAEPAPEPVVPPPEPQPSEGAYGSEAAPGSALPTPTQSDPFRHPLPTRDQPVAI